jgi:chromosome segregation ATPase
VQPWLAEESVADVRTEEMISASELQVNTWNEKIRNIKLLMNSIDSKKRDLEMRIKQLNKELLIILDPAGDVSMQKR